MFHRLSHILKKYLPIKVQRVLWCLYCLLRLKSWPQPERITFCGNFKTWDEAYAFCEGYSAPNILEKVLNSTLKVKSGEALFERDSVLFDKPQYPWQLLTSILFAASKSENKINVVDFGGSLGSSFFSCKRFIAHFDKINWTVVEQPHFVSTGLSYIADGPLTFQYNAQDAFSHNDSNLIILSAVLQYLENPHKVLESLLEKDWNYIVIDRTGLLVSTDDDTLTIQTVPSSIYAAKYPAWFFNEKRLLKHFEIEYDLFSEWKSPDKPDAPGKHVVFKGYLFSKKNDKI